MKVLVTLKSVIDHNIKVQVRSDNLDIETDNIKMSINPFDEVALEEAIRLKENGVVSEVIAVSCGINCKNILQNALAMGADRAIMCTTNTNLQSLSVAKIIKKIVEKEEIDLILLGKQSIDNDSCQTGQILAGLLECSQATFASKIDYIEGVFFVTSEIDEGSEVVMVKLPAVITVDLSLNNPRYISLQNLIKSKKKNIDIFELDNISEDLNSRLEIINLKEVQKNNKVIFLNKIEELVSNIRKIVEIT